ncbi:MAG: tRNA lysidine(34) synthetase TilS [Planctomycetia bacterium]
MSDSTAMPASAHLLLHDLAAALPRHGFWESPVIVGVSGGADSTALLLGLCHLADGLEGHRASLCVAHAEHDLRDEAAADRDVVKTLAARLGLRFETRRLPLGADAGGGGEGVEARARRLRYRFFEEVARDIGGRHVAVGHTADDQAETILHRALRGTGPAGLAGMSAARELCDGVALLRPMLGIRRSVVRRWLTDLGERWCEDATNDDTRYARNFLRHEILGRCEQGAYPAATEALVRLGGQAATLAGAIASAAEYLLDEHAMRQDGGVVLNAAAMAALDRHLLTEVFAALWRREGWPRRHMTARHYGQLAEMLASAADGGLPPRAEFPGGVAVMAAAPGRLACRWQPAYDAISTRR